MTVGEMFDELAKHEVNYEVYYDCHSKRYVINVPWLALTISDKKIDVALRLTLVEMSSEQR